MIDMELIEEIGRIQADDVQMQMVLLCMMCDPGYVQTAVAIHREAMQGKFDTAIKFAAATEAHIVEHAKQIIQLRRANDLLRAHAASHTTH